MAQLRQDYDLFKRLGAEVIVIGPDDGNSFREYWATESLPFIGIPDPKSKVLKLYGQEVNLFKLGRMPAQVTVDKSGIVRYVHYGHSMSDIPSNESILEIIKELNQEPIAN